MRGQDTPSVIGLKETNWAAEVMVSFLYMKRKLPKF